MIYRSLCAFLAAAMVASATPVSRYDSQHTVDHNVRGPRIIGGVNAAVGEFPFMVSLQDPTSGHFCGGSLVSPNYVLTAAHCVDGDSGTLNVRIGGTRITGSTDTGAARTVTNVIVHPGYSGGINDIALLKLNAPYTGSAPIALAEEEDSPAGKECTVSGWGVTDPSGGSLPTRMKKVNVNIVSTAQCNAASSYAGQVDGTTEICAGVSGGGRDSCQGDSGGPLFTSDESSSGIVQVGVVSWGNGCAEAAYPGVYARVSNYLSWIRANSDVGSDDGGDDGGDDSGDKATVRIEVTLDEYGEETSYIIVDRNNNQLHRKTFTVDDSSKKHINTYSLDRSGAPHSLVISDSYGDGICCEFGEGDLRIVVDGVVTDFDGSELGFDEKRIQLTTMSPSPSPSPSPAPEPTDPPAARTVSLTGTYGDVSIASTVDVTPMGRSRTPKRGTGRRAVVLSGTYGDLTLSTTLDVSSGAGRRVLAAAEAGAATDPESRLEATLRSMTAKEFVELVSEARDGKLSKPLLSMLRTLSLIPDATATNQPRRLRAAA